MKCIVDAQLPRSLAIFLKDSGWDAIHTLELPKKNMTPDTEISAFADEEARLVITKDIDFVRNHIVTGKPRRLLLVTTGNIVILN